MGEGKEEEEKKETRREAHATRFECSGVEGREEESDRTSSGPWSDKVSLSRLINDGPSVSGPFDPCWFASLTGFIDANPLAPLLAQLSVGYRVGVQALRRVFPVVAVCN